MNLDLPSDPIHTILLVEDEVLIRFHIADYLRECGYTVIEAAHAFEAITVLQSAEHIDLMVTDIDMPGPTFMNGVDLGRWMREHRPDVELVIASGSVKLAGEAAELCRNSPMLQKPYTEDELLNRIQHLLDRGSRTPLSSAGALVSDAIAPVPMPLHGPSKD